MAEGDHNRELPIQMSPFSHARWDIDEELARRRKQEHYDNVMPKKLHKPAPSIENEIQQRLVISDDSKPDNSNKEIKEEPFKPKSLPPPPGKIERLPFDVPPPPNLFPVIKFPERSGKTPEKAYAENQLNDAAANSHDNIVLPPKIVFRDVLPKKAKLNQTGDEPKEKLKIYHYGAQMPFWPASAKDLDY